MTSNFIHTTKEVKEVYINVKRLCKTLMKQLKVTALDGNYWR